MPDGIALRFNAYTTGPSVGTPVYDAEDERLLATVLAHPGGALLSRAGVRPGGGLEVTVGGSPEKATIAPGGGIITDTAGGGSYPFVIPAAVEIALATRPAGGTSRIDEVVARILNDQPRPADGTREVDLHVITGTAGASPTAPTIPTGQLRLAQLAVPAVGAVSVSKPPPRIAAAGGVIPVATQAERDAISPLFDGVIVYREDTDVYEGRVAGAWAKLGPSYDSGWTTLTSSVTGVGKGIRIKQVDDQVWVDIDGAFNSTSGTLHILNGSGLIPSDLRPNPALNDNYKFYGYFGGHPGTIQVHNDGNIKALQSTGSGKTSVAATFPYPLG